MSNLLSVSAVVPRVEHNMSHRTDTIDTSNIDDALNNAIKVSDSKHSPHSRPFVQDDGPSILSNLTARGFNPSMIRASLTKDRAIEGIDSPMQNMRF